MSAPVPISLSGAGRHDALPRSWPRCVSACNNSSLHAVTLGFVTPTTKGTFASSLLPKLLEHYTPRG